MHVPKTGGNSVQDALRVYADDELVALNSVQDGIERFSIKNPKFAGLHKHSALRDYQDALGNDIQNYRWVTTIRNPFDRLVSYYFSPHRGEVKWDADAFEAFIKTTIKPLDHFVSGRLDYSPNETLMLDQFTVLKFENLESDFQKLCLELGIKNARLAHRNKSHKRMDYRDCYTPELVEWVSKTYRTELEYGDYSFN